MRVVSGIAGRIPLLVPKTDLRPTMDRVKGAIFDSLGEWLIGKRVLDLFAGCGALGIEALSRGAVSAVMVEKDAPATAVIEKNLVKTKLQQGGSVVRSDVFSYLHRRRPDAALFELILADPPYEKGVGARDYGMELLGEPALAQALAPDGWLVLERRPGVRWKVPPAWEVIRERRYGGTETVWLRKAGALQPTVSEE